MAVIKYRLVLKGNFMNLNYARLRNLYKTLNDGWYGTWVKCDGVFKLLTSNCI